MVRQSLFCIGVSGVHSGCGTTHTAIMTAVYLSKYCGYRTAYVEFGASPQIHQIAEAAWMDGTNHLFQYSGIWFYTAAGRDKLQEARTAGYEAIVLDLGSRRMEWVEGSCSLRFVVGDTAPWRRQELIRWIHSRTEEELRHYRILIPMAEKKELMCLDHHGRIEPAAVPFQRNPFGIKPPVIQLMKSLIQV